MGRQRLHHLDHKSPHGDWCNLPNTKLVSGFAVLACFSDDWRGAGQVPLPYKTPAKDQLTDLSRSEEASGVDLDEFLPDAVDDMTTDTDNSPGPGLEVTVAPTLRLPPRSYDPRERSSSPRFEYGEHSHGLDENTLPPFRATQGIQAPRGGSTFGSIRIFAQDDVGLPPADLDQPNQTV